VDKPKKKGTKEPETFSAPVPSAWRTMWNEIYRDKIALVALITFIVLVIGTFVLAHMAYGTEATFVNIRTMNQRPGGDHILGTDFQGRGVAEILVLGARTSLIVGFTVTIIASIVGILIGLFAGFYGGHFDNVIMRIVDTWMMLPTLMIIVVVVTIIPGYTTTHFVLVMAAFGWTGTARIIRAVALQQRNLDYVSASKTLGTRNIVIMFREVLPSLVPVITVNLTLTTANNIGIETGLTFLGFGLPFGVPSLGAMLSRAQFPYTLQNRMWQWLPAALLVITLMLCIYCVGQALSRASNIRQRRG